MFPANNLDKYFDELSLRSWTLIPTDVHFVSEVLEAALKKAQSFRPATITQQRQESPGVRGDSILWLDDNDDHRILSPLNSLRSGLKEYFRMPLNELECHFAVYPTGRGYDRHRDTTPVNNRRVFSFVLYLNPVWEESDGGHLQGYEEDSVLFRIQPKAGNLILFSSELEHEVLPARRERWSLTGWMRR